ncbi:MAG: phage portal protein [Selenomonadaceae bacterium]|nr:phage portal protein [Clostridia bacterium]MBR4695828.1 phage portal protein [Selenomonadaceae bacterium]
MFARIIAWLKGIMSRVLKTGDLQINAGVPLAISNSMAQAIQRWRDEYSGNAPWLSRNRQSLSLPALISAEMATLVTLEAKIEIAGSPRADFISKQFEPVRKQLQKNVEYACAMGGIVMKPYIDNTGGIAVDYIQADDFFPVAFNSRGEITSAIFVERKRIMQTVYSRVEHHTIEGSKYTIVNKCFRGYSEDDPGTEVPLSEVPEWQQLQPVVTMENISFPLFAYFRIPLGNPIDPKSPLGVSVFAKAENNIKEADRQYQRLLWEYEGGELAIDASMDAFDLDKHGKPIVPVGKDRLWRVNYFDSKRSAGKDVLFSTFAPALRDSSYIAGLNKILQKIEDQCGLARGTLSDRADVQTQTATEIKMLRQRTYATTTSIQTALEDAIRALINAMDATATLYNLTPPGDIEVSCVWDDSIVTDSDMERVRDMQEIRDGIMKKWEYRVKWYGEDEGTAKAMVENEPSNDEIMGFVTTAQRNNGETGGNQNGKG